MIFWTSFLVFLATLMLYILLPARTDQIALDHYRDDPLIISFVDQHQAAKNYMDQMIMWKTSGESDKPIHPLNNTKLAKFMPKGLQTGGGTYHDIGTQSDIASGYDAYVSGMICLDSSDNLVDCTATNNSYVITYGYVPGWWDITNMGRQGYWEGTDDDDDPVILVSKLWLKSMLRRTHGSTQCGRLLLPSDRGNKTAAYTIDNGQEYGGFVNKTVSGKQYKTIPDTIGVQLKTLLPNTEKADPQLISSYKSDTAYGKEYALICMTPYENPYEQTPIFHWDLSNNKDGQGHQAIDDSSFGTPLVGSLSGKVMKCGESGAECHPTDDYTLSGVVMNYYTNSAGGKVPLTANSTGITLMTLDGTKPVQYACSGTCSLTIGDVSWGGIPANKPFAFYYVKSGSTQKLNVSYTTCGTTCAFPAITWKTSTNTPPTILNPTMNSLYLVDVMLYDESLTNAKVSHNNKAHHRRFGI